MVWEAIDRESGEFCYVEDHVGSLILEINRLHPNIRVRYLNPNHPSVSVKDPPYQIVEMLPNGREALVFTCWSLDSDILGRIAAYDTAMAGKADLAKASRQKPEETSGEKAWRERREFGKDVITTMAKTPGTSFSFKDPDSGETHKVSDG